MSAFSRKIIVWQEREGRNDLPWQGTRDPYRIWVSEIMLQQTQVAAVVPYFVRFMQRFPDVHSLARAADDEVMQLWAGLGYYARARNLHKAAKLLAAQDAGFPVDYEAILALPGIGRSTAAAIAAFAYGQRRAILDGNVKRVFARHFGVAGDIRAKPVEDRLWELAEDQLPTTGIERYTQGLMDLGATICTRTQPTCLLCPVSGTCAAFNEGRVGELPGKGEKRETPHRQTRMLVVLSRGEVLLEKRPPSGIWGGLWCLPELPVDADVFDALHKRYGVKGRIVRELARVEHGFTHYSLSIFPLEIAVTGHVSRAAEPGLIWLDLTEAGAAAVPAPVKRILAAHKK